jgi:hypothetical protein
MTRGVRIRTCHHWEGREGGGAGAVAAVGGDVRPGDSSS